MRQSGEQIPARLATLILLAGLNFPVYSQDSAKKLWQDRMITITSASADGRWLAVSDGNDLELFVRDTATGATRNLTNKGSFRFNDSMAEYPVISADGQWVAYTWYDVRAISAYAASKPLQRLFGEQLE